ncbi:hypothetical protein [Roseovarius rhodophyticola]|uniref:Uncharacterized protein n=1 Tax=Roseovarius rhodophyticola TaxID=3080827 RepID=A0ABZ2TG25_9RHOB|nr:hypothetical protein [Roseovarius sp. W115]MDV2928957.1 hypothetical protein [Roseovarius sp. W115]
MAAESSHGHAHPSWFVAPGESDTFAWFSIALILLAIYGIVTLYAAFDRWAEHQSKGTPLAKTIPTMLTIALLYELFPLSHFNILLPLSAILIALMADWSRFNLGRRDVPEPMVEPEPVPEPQAEEAERV